MSAENLYAEYMAKMQKIADVKYAAALMQWDQETYIPEKGHDIRGRQLATLSELAHEMFTDEKLGSLLQELLSKNTLAETRKRNVERTWDDYCRNIKIPSALVKKMSEATSKGFSNWVKAKKENNFQLFKDSLTEIVALKKQEAELLGCRGHIYNALMNDYDKGLTVDIVDTVFAELKPQLSSLLAQIESRPQVDDSFLKQHFDRDTQWKFGMEILKKMGFDFESGRQDISEHPFTINFNSNDVRLTTRIDENDFGNMTWSCLHEGGHGLYEQGLPGHEYGLPLGEACSFSMHESQSRLWENCIGRGLPFWKCNFSGAQTFFNKQFGNISVEQFYKAINKVAPSLIRTEADELTYHFHVMIRYEIEKGLIEGNIAAKDVPVYWNEHYKDYLGITVPDDKTGCLQDVHWSHGSFGYFATYSLGSLYAAQLYAAVRKDNASLEKEIEEGNNSTLLQWLREKVHKPGRYYTSEELCRKATGEALQSRYFIEYAIEKFSDIYSIKMA